MTESELQAASWLHKHRDLLKRVGYGIFIGFDVIIVLTVLFQLGTYIINYQASKQAYISIADTQINYSSIEAPKPLQIIEKGVVPYTTGEYDSFAVIQSPNEKYIGRFSYTFNYAGQTIDLDDGYIFPNSEQVLVVAGFKNEAGGGTLTAQLGDVEWERIKGSRPGVNFIVSNEVFKRISVPTNTVNENTNTGDLTGASEELLDNANVNSNVNSNVNGNTNSNVNANANLNSNTNTNRNTNVNTNLNFTPSTNTNENSNTNANDNTNEFFRPEDADTEINTTNTTDYTSLTAEIFNDSAYGFRSVQVIVLLRNSQDAVVGVAKRVLRDVASLSTTQIDITWEKPFAIDVQPEIMVTTDYFNEENLILPGQD